MAILAVIGIVYAAAVALRQRDLKFVIGYSSVSHMGFVLLGLATANVLGVSGAVLQMFSHGVIGALLFAVAGSMIYRRTHTRDLDELSLMELNRALPFAAFVFVIASAASMGIPGFSGFAAEITILIGVWKAFPIAVWITGAGMVLVAAFTLRALKRSFFEGGSAALLGDVKSSPPLMTSPAQRPIHLAFATREGKGTSRTARMSPERARGRLKEFRRPSWSWPVGRARCDRLKILQWRRGCVDAFETDFWER